jgi:ATP-dependent Lon protease
MPKPAKRARSDAQRTSAKPRPKPASKRRAPKPGTKAESKPAPEPKPKRAARSAARGTAGARSRAKPQKQAGERSRAKPQKQAGARSRGAAKQQRDARSRRAAKSPRGGSAKARAANAARARKANAPDELILIAVRGMALFPGVVLPVSVGRPRSVRAVQAAVAAGKPIGILLQRNPQADEPTPDDLYRVGTQAEILRSITAPDGGHHVIVQGQRRFRVREFLVGKDLLRARVEFFEDERAHEHAPDVEARFLNLKQQAQEAIALLPQKPEDLDTAVQNASSPSALTDIVATFMELAPEEKQDILETRELKPRMDKVAQKLQHLVEVLRLSRDLRQSTRGTLEKAQRDYYLREQLKTIQKELGEGSGPENAELGERLAKAGLSPEAEAQVKKELRRLERMSDGSAEASMVRTWVDWMLDLPWSKLSEDVIELDRARAVLDEDHHGLEKVKRRIVEFLAVHKLKPAGKSPILCLVGPPGVGKTSLGQSIARAMGRSFARASLGGVHDEAEIRGHRRTYVGALPGKIVQGLRKAGTRNPVFMLDEMDKLSASYHGDPSAALLEVLDPEQNASFHDNYLGVSFDLSRVLFIGTANLLEGIPGPLRDRMEVIELSGYTEEEKLEIARRYLIPRQLDANGLAPARVEFAPEALLELARHYTREAGCRALERQIGAVCRSIAARIASAPVRVDASASDALRAGVHTAVDSAAAAPLASADAAPAEIAAVPAALAAEHVAPAPETPAPLALERVELAEIARVLGPRKYESELAQRTSVPGVATGLAWTPVGGDILFVEATRMRGKGELILTGQLGEVMRESARAAVSLVRAHAPALGLSESDFARTDLHLHVPAGGVPKDGPSAGVALYTALASLMLARRVRPDVAMTGEISLRGLVLPVGGIPEKVLAAYRAGIRTVLLPARNAKDLVELPASAREGLHIVELDNVEQALEHALEPADSAAEQRADPGPLYATLPGDAAG